MFNLLSKNHLFSNIDKSEAWVVLITWGRNGYPERTVILKDYWMGRMLMTLQKYYEHPKIILHPNHPLILISCSTPTLHGDSIATLKDCDFGRLLDGQDALNAQAETEKMIVSLL